MKYTIVKSNDILALFEGKVEPEFGGNFCGWYSYGDINKECIAYYKGDDFILFDTPEIINLKVEEPYSYNKSIFKFEVDEVLKALFVLKTLNYKLNLKLMKSVLKNNSINLKLPNL